MRRKGVVEVLASDEYAEGDLTIQATITAENYEDGEITELEISSADQNIQVDITSKMIKDVTISWNEDLVYTGESQELVSVTQVEGDTITYEIDGEIVTIPEKMEAGTYTVKVTVERTGKNPLTATKDITIAAKTLEIGITASTDLVYNSEEQALVTVPTGIEIGDKVTWTIGDITETYTVDADNIDFIPRKTNVGEYKVKLSVERNANYTVYNSEEMTVNISATPIENLAAELVSDLVYNGDEQELVKKDAATNVYISGLEDGDKVYYIVGTDADAVAASDAWVEWTESSKPVGQDAGDYTVRIKVVRTNYNDTEVELNPATVTISKANQSFNFTGEGTQGESKIELSGKLPFEKEYNFSATDTEALAGGSITYSVELDEEGIASISDTGMLTVDFPGEIKVIATLSGNDNYNECVIEYTLDVSGVVSAQGQYISFANEQVDYILGSSDIISENAATKDNNKIRGNISYAMENVAGVSIDSNSGKVTVTNYDELATAIHAKDGTLEFLVTATKEKSGRYGEDTISYMITMSFEETPANPYTLSVADGTNGWYKTYVTVTPAEGYSIAQAASGNFAAATKFEDQGIAERYIYLKNTETGGITDIIAVTDELAQNIKIDSVPAENLDIQYSKLTLIEEIGQSLGFYNPTITITFSAEDATSGIESFEWTYTPENGDPVTEKIAITTEGNKAMATLTLPAEEAEQLHGKISFTVTDKASNTIGKSDDYIFIVDTIAPGYSIKYQGETPYEAQVNEYDGAHVFNSDVEVELTITETHFYSEDVVVKVSKDGAEEIEVTPTWNDKVGTFTLAGDGDYVVYVTYTDKADNEMDAYTSEVITVDKTAPIVEMSFDQEKQATIFKVTEHNFRPSDVVITGEMKDILGADIDYTAAELTTELQNADWTKNGDVYTYEFDQYVNGIYKLSMDYTDVAGWKATQYVADAFTVDHLAPTGVSIEIVTDPIETWLNVITFGTYKPSVTIKFTAYDDAAGVESFTWNYIKENGASDTNRPTDEVPTVVPAEQDATDNSKYTATVTLPVVTAAEELRGYLAVVATDTYGNNSEKVTDSGNIIIVDTIAPEVSVEYSVPSNTVGNKAYYNGNIEATITVEEANFYSEDVVVKVSKNGETAESVTPVWSVDQTDSDIHYGKFTITGDGHYIVTAQYEDRAQNYDEAKSTYISDELTVDTTKPVINVEYQNKTAINTLVDSENNNRKYFDNTQTAVVTITEHNFDESGVVFDIVAKDVTGAALSVDTLHTNTTN